MVTACVTMVTACVTMVTACVTMVTACVTMSIVDVPCQGNTNSYHGDNMHYYGNNVRVSQTPPIATQPPRFRYMRDMGTQTDMIEETCVTTDNCTCELCSALTAHLEELALSMGIGSEVVHLFVHVCQTCPLLAEESRDR